jgi:hypothetical protein
MLRNHCVLALTALAIFSFMRAIGVEKKAAPAAASTTAPSLQVPPEIAPEATEAELTHWLLVNVPEVDLDSVAGTGKGLLDRARPMNKKATPDDRPIADLVQKRPDLRGLPLVLGEACRTDQTASADLQAFAALAKARVAREPMAEMYTKLRKPKAVAALHQVMQVEDEAERSYLTDALSAIPRRTATVALARRAVFDLSAKVRREAIAALRKRSAEDYRTVLLEGLRYPWAPAALHAAEALVALEDRDAVSELVAMLDLSDPERPVQRSDGQWEKPQLVRVNHLRNCLLCHPAAVAGDPLPGQIPIPGRPLPTTQYTMGTCPNPNIRNDEVFVRADVVYLRQDFSVKQPVEKCDPWPKMQRYDYLVRKQELTEEQAKEWLARRSPSPQRAAILHALRGLTRLNAGDSSAAWKTALVAKK